MIVYYYDDEGNTKKFLYDKKIVSDKHIMFYNRNNTLTLFKHMIIMISKTPCDHLELQIKNQTIDILAKKVEQLELEISILIDFKKEYYHNIHNHWWK